MKIGILTTYFHPVIGGAENVMLNQAKELSKKNEVHVFTTDRRGDQVFKKEEKFGNIFIHRSRTWFRYKYYIAFYPGIIFNLLKYKLDILHVHSLGFFQHDLAILAKKLQDKDLKLICTPHGVPLAIGKHSLSENFLKRFYLLFSRFMNKLYSIFIKVNPYSYEIFKEFGIPKEKLKLIPNAVDKKIFLPSKKTIKKEILKKYSLKGKFVVTYLGRIQEYKGLDQIVKTLHSVKKIKDVVFIAMGEDSGDKKRLLKLANSLKVAKNVIFTGRVGEDEKKAILELSDIFIFPSKDEAFGIAMLEAMAKGNAIISTRTQGGRYLIKKENGFLYDFGDVKDLEKKLFNLLKEDKTRKKMQKTNILKSKNFTWDKVNKKLIRLYESLLAK